MVEEAEEKGCKLVDTEVWQQVGGAYTHSHPVCRYTCMLYEAFCVPARP